MSSNISEIFHMASPKKAATKKAVKKTASKKAPVKKAATKKSAVKKAAPKKAATKKTVTKKKVAAKKKVAVKKKVAAKKKAAGAASREKITALRAALNDARSMLKNLRIEANKEIKDLKDALKVAQTREGEIRKLVTKKVQAMVAYGEKWEKNAMKQIEKRRSGKKKTRRRATKKKS